MHNRNVPSFFLTNSTGAPHGDVLGLINPLSNISSNCALSSFSSAGAIRYGAFEIGVVPGTNSIPNSTFRSGGNPTISSGNTSTNSETTGIVLISGTAAAT